MRRLLTLLGAAALGLAASCGGGYGSNSGPTSPGGGNNGGGSTSNAISVMDNSFSPASTTVPIGTTVTWTWGGSRSHNVTFDDGTASTTQTTGTYTRTFNTAGSFPYHCTIHGTAMSGTITVK